MLCTSSNSGGKHPRKLSEDLIYDVYAFGFYITLCCKRHWTCLGSFGEWTYVRIIGQDVIFTNAQQMLDFIPNLVKSHIKVCLHGSISAWSTEHKWQAWKRHCFHVMSCHCRSLGKIGYGPPSLFTLHNTKIDVYAVMEWGRGTCWSYLEKKQHTFQLSTRVNILLMLLCDKCRVG